MQIPDKLLALTCHPEWAWAIAHFKYNPKRHENRSWPPPERILNKWIALHAGKHIGGRPGERHLLEGLTELREDAENAEEDLLDRISAGGGIPVYSELIPEIKTSAIVALIKVSGYHAGEGRAWFRGHPWIGWVISECVTLPEPVPCKGAQGLWTVPPDVLAAVRAQLAAVSP